MSHTRSTHITPEALHNTANSSAASPRSNPPTPPTRSRQELELAETEPDGTPAFARHHESIPIADGASQPTGANPREH